MYRTLCFEIKSLFKIGYIQKMKQEVTAVWLRSISDCLAHYDKVVLWFDWLTDLLIDWLIDLHFAITWFNSYEQTDNSFANQMILHRI